MQKWIAPNTITGDAATGDRYLRREHINEDFWREVRKGNHILFVAPRRVGKSSIMKDLAGNPPDGFSCIYQNIEGVKSRNEFYKRLFELTLHCVNKVEKAKALFNAWRRQYGITEISKAGIKFENREVDYESELRNLIPQLVSANIHTVIFLDEFAEVVSKLSKGQKQDAIDILHTLREFRGDEDFRHFTLVFAGSIGLEFVIKSIDRPKLINDLHRIETTALSSAEAKKLISQLLQGATIKFSDGPTEYLLQKTGHLLPYYVQLMLEEIDLVARDKDDPNVSNAMIDKAFEGVVRKNKNFDDWLERLRDYQSEHFPFINEILKHCAHKNFILIQEVYDMAGKHSRTEDYMDFVEQLQHDGYLIETEHHHYRFLSPFLQQFWLNKFPVYHVK